MHVPYHLLWELEHIEHDEQFTELASLAELPAWLRRAAERRRLTGAGRRSELAQVDLADAVVGRLAQDNDARSRVGRMFSRRFLPLIAPDERGGLDRLLVGEMGEVLEEAVGVLEHGLAQLQEALHVPLLDVVLVGVDVDAEVEVVADELLAAVADLQHVEPSRIKMSGWRTVTRPPWTMS